MKADAGSLGFVSQGGSPSRPVIGAGVIQVHQKVSREIPAALKQGDALDGFRLLRPLRQDGRTWLAEKQGNLRVLRFPEVAARDAAAFLSRFLDEADGAVRLGETGFFPRAWIPEDSSHRYYAIDFVEAPTLRSVLDGRCLSVGEALELGRFLLGVGQKLLRSDAVHEKVRPENVLVVPDGGAVRFQLAQSGCVDDALLSSSRDGAPILLDSAAMGTHAIGFTLFEALTGIHPYRKTGSVRARWMEHRSMPLPSSFNPEVPSWLDRLLHRSMAIEPAYRYQTYWEMLFDLEYPDTRAAGKQGGPLRF